MDIGNPIDTNQADSQAAAGLHIDIDNPIDTSPADLLILDKETNITNSWYNIQTRQSNPQITTHLHSIKDHFHKKPNNMALDNIKVDHKWNQMFQEIYKKHS